MKSKSIWVVAVAVVLVAGISLAYANQTRTVRELEVKIGERGAKGKTVKSKDHSITLQALQQARSEYWVKRKKNRYLIHLEREQIMDLAQGSTIVVDTVLAKETKDEDGKIQFVPVTDVDPEVPELVVSLLLKEKKVSNRRPPFPGGSSGGGGW
ncbi:MAG: hypothetical protein ACE5HV_17180 [Acidobacteriota bacterium]